MSLSVHGLPDCVQSSRDKVSQIDSQIIGSVLYFVLNDTDFLRLHHAMKDNSTSPQFQMEALAALEVDPTRPPLVEMRGITKRFPGVVANDNISLIIRRGEIQTLLGENGAGKSTLLNILSGMIQPDEGQILIDGQAVSLTSPQVALKQGMGTVYQHFTLVPNLSVIENIILGLNADFTLNLRQSERQLQELWGDFGLSVSPQMEVQYLSIGQQQRVEIIKVLWRGSRVLLLDEPTSVLTPLEVKELFEILGSLKAKGVAVLFITHKLEEALAISDRITVLRQGRWVGELEPAELNQQNRAAISQRIVEMMFGESTSLSLGSPDATHFQSASHLIPGRTVCILNEVTALNDRGTPAVRDVTLQLQAGEIFGVAGVDSNGQKELAEVIAGQRRVSRGQVIVDGVNITNRGTSAAEKVGIGYVTDDRLGEGCVPSLSVAENLVMKVVNQPPFSSWTLLNRTAIAAHAHRLIQQFNIKTPGPEVRVGTLSGGNMQKLLLARELALKPKVLICNKPTQGLDVLTAQFVLRTLQEQAEQGLAVILISAELDELLALSDRIGVMYNGRMLDIIPRDKADRETIGRLMLGVAP